ncbi:MAG: L-threonylcarbamoyladenylate synthase, partial [Bacteroidales bacterium]
MIIRLYEENTSEREIERVTEMLRDGAVIIYPTDTVYAIGCDALNVRAAERICHLKGINPLKSNLSIIGADLSSLSKYVKISDRYYKIIKHNTPGPFTFILPTASSLPKLYKNRKSVGIRIPANKIPIELTKSLGNPLLTSSLHDDDDNGYLTNPELIAERYAGIADIIIDGGIGGVLISTIVDCTSENPEITR